LAHINEGVYDYLWGNLDAANGPNPNAMFVLDGMIAYKFGSCDTERYGSLMNREKPKGSSRLGDDVLPMLLFLGSNMCHPHEMGDCNRFIDQWMADGHRLPALEQLDKNDGDSIVHERLRGRKSQFFLGKPLNYSGPGRAIAPGNAREQGQEQGR